MKLGIKKTAAQRFFILNRVNASNLYGLLWITPDQTSS
jgi:hypothetical protein